MPMGRRPTYDHITPEERRRRRATGEHGGPKLQVRLPPDLLAWVRTKPAGWVRELLEAEMVRDQASDIPPETEACHRCGRAIGFGTCCIYCIDLGDEGDVDNPADSHS